MNFSPSKFNNYEQCPWKFKRIFIDGFKEPQNEYTSLGNFVHHSMEIYQKHLKNIKQNKDNAFMRELFKNTYKETMGEFAEKYESEAKELVNNAIRYGFNHETVINIETWIDLVFPEGKIKCKVDRIDVEKGKVILIDWKTGGKVTPERYLKNDYQYIVYSYFLHSKFKNVRQRIGRWVYLSPDTTLEMQAEDFDVCEEKITAIMKRINSDKKFEPLPNRLCDWCTFGKDRTCPIYSHLPPEDAGDQEELFT